MKVPKEVLEQLGYSVLDIVDPLYSYAKQKYQYNPVQGRKMSELYQLSKQNK